MKKFFLIFLIILIFGKIKSAEIEKTQIWLHKAQEKFNNFENDKDIFKNSKINGLEIDVYYEKNTKRLYLSHEKPLENLKNIYNINYLKKFKNINLWIDFKNLKEVPINQIDILSAKFSELAEHNNLFLESQNLFKLKMLSTHELKIIYNLPILFENKFFLIIMKYFLKLINFNFISTSEQNLFIIDQVFDSKNLFIYTVNNSNKICKIIKETNVKVILTDLVSFNHKCD